MSNYPMHYVKSFTIEDRVLHVNVASVRDDYAYVTSTDGTFTGCLAVPRADVWVANDPLTFGRAPMITRGI